MSSLEIPKAFLGYLYSYNFGNTDPSLDMVDQWIDSCGIDRSTFWKQYELMIRVKLCRMMQDDGTVRLTPKGTLHAEKMGLATVSSIARNRDMRKRLMYAMAYCLEKYGPVVMLDDIIKVANLRDEEYIGNLRLLVEMGFAKWRINFQQLTINPKVCAKTGTLSKVA